MLNINFEFRKGIFFIRLIGEMINNNYKIQIQELEKIITENEFKYIVININYLNKIDLEGINYLIDECLVNNHYRKLIICDKLHIIKRLSNSSILNINSELEVL